MSRQFSHHPRSPRISSLPVLALALNFGISLLATGVLAHEPVTIGTQEPAFVLRPLGVLGGDCDTNLSCYLLGRVGDPAARLMIDGGTVVPGILAWKSQTDETLRDAPWTARIARVLEVLKPLDAFLLTHSHMDHIGGFIQKSTLDVLLAIEGRTPFPIVGLPATLQALETHVFRSPLWVDLTRIPPERPAFVLSPLPPGCWKDIGPFRVRAVEINHPVPCSAFFIASDRRVYLHLGDSGMTDQVWKDAQPYLESGTLSAVSLEISFPVSMEKLARESGHLTRNSFLLELNKLARAESGPLPEPEDMTEAFAESLARSLAPRLKECPVIVTHIKALFYERVLAELVGLRRAGLNLVIPRQGHAYSF